MPSPTPLVWAVDYERQRQWPQTGRPTSSPSVSSQRSASNDWPFDDKYNQYSHLRQRVPGPQTTYRTPATPFNTPESRPLANVPTVYDNLQPRFHASYYASSPEAQDEWYTYAAQQGARDPPTTAGIARPSRGYLDQRFYNDDAEDDVDLWRKSDYLDAQNYMGSHFAENQAFDATVPAKSGYFIDGHFYEADADADAGAQPRPYDADAWLRSHDYHLEDTTLSYLDIDNDLGDEGLNIIHNFENPDRHFISQANSAISPSNIINNDGDCEGLPTLAGRMSVSQEDTAPPQRDDGAVREAVPGWGRPWLNRDGTSPYRAKGL